MDIFWACTSSQPVSVVHWKGCKCLQLKSKYYDNNINAGMSLHFMHLCSESLFELISLKGDAIGWVRDVMEMCV